MHILAKFFSLDYLIKITIKCANDGSCVNSIHLLMGMWLIFGIMLTLVISHLKTGGR